MTLTVFNTKPINLTCSISAPDLALHHGSNALADHDNELSAELPETPPIEATEVMIADFTVDGSTHKVYAWEEDAAGGVVQWDRISGGCSSGPRSEMPETQVLVVAVPPRISVPDPGSTNGPPKPGTSQTTIKVKVRKQGSMPF